MKTKFRTTAPLSGNKIWNACLTGFFCLIAALNCMALPSNKCLSFNGVNSKVYFSNSDLQLSNNNEMAIGAWINWGNKANAGASATIISICNSSNGDGQFWLQHDSTNSYFQFVLKTDSGQKVTVTSHCNLVQGNWYYVMGVFKVNKIELYVNGLLEGCKLVTTGTYINPFNSTFKTTIGNNAAGNQGFNGLIDEVSVWNSMPFDSVAVRNMMLLKINYQSAAYSYWGMDTLNADTLIDTGLNATKGIISNVTVTNMGAPAGETSLYLPPNALNKFKYVSGTHNDSLLIDSLSFTASSGIYVYEIDGTPADSTIPTGIDGSGIKYYYGIFVPGYISGTYKTTYYFNPTSTKKLNAAVANTGLVLLEKNGQNPLTWTNTGAAYNASRSCFSHVSHSQWSEYMVGSVNSTGIANTLNSFPEIGKAYPNPFSSNFSLVITCAESMNLNVRLMGVDGTLVYENKLFCGPNANELNFENLSGLANGLYVLTLSSETGYNKTVKMIKN
jgi:hypothetical protein